MKRKKRMKRKKKKKRKKSEQFHWIVVITFHMNRFNMQKETEITCGSVYNQMRAFRSNFAAKYVLNIGEDIIGNKSGP